MALGGGIARGQLKWETTRVEFHPAITEKAVTAEFPFTNAGTTPVAIDSVNSGCGCTTATLDKLVYQPGEKGKVSATFHIGERTGLQEKVVRVNIHGIKDPIVLTLATYLPELMRIEPRYLFWRVGDDPVPRFMKLTALPEARLLTVHVFSNSDRFKASMQPTHKGGSYLLVVTPTDTATDGKATLAIETMADPGVPGAPAVPKSFEAFASITPR